VVEAIAERRSGVVLEGVQRVLGGKLVLDGVTLELPVHGRLGIVGRSASGKSTLLSIVAGLDAPDGGTVKVAGGCALMPQRDSLLPWRSALDNACLPLENRGVSKAEARRSARELFARVGLAGSERLRPAQLSGGMRQRVAFVRTLLAEKEVLLLDEPFGALDAITRAELQEWLRTTLADEPRTVLLVTHDVEEALLMCGTVAVLARGQISASFDVDVPHVRTDTAFVELRERVLAAIG
jgi:NitT/TauT family transport system ATP-binding protein